MLCPMTSVAPESVPGGDPGTGSGTGSDVRVQWLPLALFGAIAAASVPLYHSQLSGPWSGWVSYAPLTRTASWSATSGGAYSSSFFVAFHTNGGLLGLGEGWYWAAALAIAFAVTTWWYRRAARQPAARVPGFGYLAAGLALTTAATAAPLLLASNAALPAWLWLSGQWDNGAFALAVIAAALLMAARRARSRAFWAVALIYAGVMLLVDSLVLGSAPQAMTLNAGNVQPLVISAAQPQFGVTAALLPALVLLAAAAAIFVRPLLSRRDRSDSIGS